MKRVKEEFVMIFNKVQQKDDLFVSWKNQFLCLPTVTTAKEEESKCLRLKSIKKSDDTRETTLVESNKALTTKGNQEDVCSLRDENRLSAISPHHSMKAADEEDNDFDFQFVDGENDAKKLLPNRESPSLPLLSNACFENLHIVERDSEPVKAVISFDECQQNNPKTTLNKQEHIQAVSPLGNGVVNISKSKDALCCSPDSNGDSKNIHSTPSSVCLKPTEKDDSESQTLDSTFTDVTSVWGGSMRSLSPSVNSVCETPSPETVVSLQLQRQNIALELVWLQQAIASRKNYLRLKHQMDSS